MIESRQSLHRSFDKTAEPTAHQQTIDNAPTSETPSPLMVRPSGSTLAFVLAALAGIIFAFIASYSSAESLTDSDTRVAEINQQFAENQYVTALLTAISAAEVDHQDMATFANQQLHQATYCLMLTHPNPVATLSELTQQVTFQPQAQTLLAHFETIKSSFDMEQVRSDHPCNHAQFPADALLAATF